jgi:hypothetical protein
LQLSERVAQRPHLLGHTPLKNGHQAAYAIDRILHLIQVALILEASSETESAAAQVEQRHSCLEDHLRGCDAIELGFIGGPQLIVVGLLIGHTVTSAE